MGVTKLAGFRASSVLFVRQAQHITIGAERIEQRLLVGQDLGCFCCADELDHIALLSVTLFVDEGPCLSKNGQAFAIAEIRNGATVGVTSVTGFRWTR